MKRIALEQSVLLASPQDLGGVPNESRKRWTPPRRVAGGSTRELGAVSLLAVHHTAARTGRTFETENSLAGFAPFSKALFHRPSLALGNFPFQFGQQRHSTTARREITLDLFVPGSPVEFAEPACQNRLLLRR